MNTTPSINISHLPDERGYFGEFGGSFIPPQLATILDEITLAYEQVRHDEGFRAELADLLHHYSGRPTPVYHARRLSAALGGAGIYLKREDLNHTGAHKLNHCLGEALLARRMGKKKLIAETGAGQHGVALATAATLVGLACDIYMGAVDIEKQRANVSRMRMLGARVIPATTGLGTLKEAVDLAFEEYVKDPVTQFYAIGSVVGPHPFPAMVRDFQRVVGDEARVQFQELTGRLPDMLAACVGGGSNAIGLFTAFLEDTVVELVGVEPAGRGLSRGDHAATLTHGRPGILHGFRSIVLCDEAGVPDPVHSVGSGLVYPSVGPQHSHLRDVGRVRYVTASDDEAVDAFFTLSRTEGIIPALESAHAVAFAIREAPRLPGDTAILVNLSGRGDKDLDYVLEHHGDRMA
ncbi:MAG: tryptophan synthase subunit beta [Deltaproteobacteria bacterium HGW-Deltaproteobacteria-22]|nr:MAG: tryptophan synthase subunit beta [Deltaproteobacteria bacterium HGW-Deltaproteobacteria-22]